MWGRSPTPSVHTRVLFTDVISVPHCRLFTLGLLGSCVYTQILPQEALERLRHGNQEFAAGTIDTSHVAAGKGTVALKPIASILSCSDLGVSPEVIFGHDDLFVVRVSGAGASQAVLGSLEYAAEQLGSRLLVVMGHTSCGAVKVALEAQVPKAHMKLSMNLQGVLNLVRPAFDRPQERDDPWTSAVYASVEQTLDDIVQHSPVIGEMAHRGQLTLVGAVYWPDSGKVVFSKPIAFSNIQAEPVLPRQRPLAIAHGESK
jgi:carbonic anhydrase